MRHRRGQCARAAVVVERGGIEPVIGQFARRPVVDGGRTRGVAACRLPIGLEQRDAIIAEHRTDRFATDLERALGRLTRRADEAFGHRAVQAGSPLASAYPRATDRTWTCRPAGSSVKVTRAQVANRVGEPEYQAVTAPALTSCCTSQCPNAT